MKCEICGADGASEFNPRDAWKQPTYAEKINVCSCCRQTMRATHGQCTWEGVLFEIRVWNEVSKDRYGEVRPAKYSDFVLIFGNSPDGTQRGTWMPNVLPAYEKYTHAVSQPAKSPTKATVETQPKKPDWTAYLKKEEAVAADQAAIDAEARIRKARSELDRPCAPKYPRLQLTADLCTSWSNRKR